MKNNLLSISEFAEMCNVTPETLRFYDRKGLFFPNYIDPKTKYRYYNYSGYRCLKVITNLRSQGFTIAEIDSIFSANKQQILIDYYTNGLTDINNEIEKLMQAKKNIENTLDFLTGKGKTQVEWELKEIPERPIFSIDNNTICSEADYYKSISNMEVYLNRKSINKNLIFTNNYLACRWDIEKNEFCNLIIFDQHEKSDISPKGLYLCKVIKGRLFSIPRYISEIRDVLTEKELEQNGLALVIALGESVILSPCINMLYEVQIPVKKINDN